MKRMEGAWQKLTALCDSVALVVNITPCKPADGLYILILDPWERTSEVLTVQGRGK
jgi:hypothetical protein